MASYETDFATPRVERRDLGNGAFVLSNQVALDTVPDSMGHYLTRWERERPDHPFLAERDETGGWAVTSYGMAAARVRALGGRILAADATPERPVVILSGNSVRSGLLMLAAMHVGVPCVPVSPAYSLASGDFQRLSDILAQTTPGIVYVETRAPFAAALEGSAMPPQTPVWLGDDPGFYTDPGNAEAVAKAAATVGPATIAKILFTSGSTGRPKGVINTQAMMVTNQQAIVQCWPFLNRRPPVLVDWLPWSHTFGSNHNFNLVLRHGGTLYIDHGKPDPKNIHITLDNLRDISPTIYFNVPRGYDALIGHLEADRDLAARFFRNLDLIFYAGAALPPPLWRRIEDLARDVAGEVPLMTSSWGSTETAPMATCAHYPIDRPGNIGIPTPGTEIKFVPAMDKMELRVRGACVFPGYWRAPDLTAAAFDEDGFYRIGDAGKLADPHDPAKGILFDGRTAENFKLTTGTWVHVGVLRIDVLAALAPIASDLVIAGADRDWVGCLIFLNAGGAAAALGRPSGDTAGLATDPALHAEIGRRLAAHNAQNSGTSRRIARALILDAPPDIDAGEITDKGYLNQRAILEGRAGAVATLYADPPSDPVIIVP